MEIVIEGILSNINEKSGKLTFFYDALEVRQKLNNVISRDKYKCVPYTLSSFFVNRKQSEKDLDMNEYISVPVKVRCKMQKYKYKAPADKRNPRTHIITKANDEMFGIKLMLLDIETLN